MAVVLLLMLALVGFRTLFADRIYPAVVVGDVPVGGMTLQQAEARLTERAAALAQGTVAFSFEGQTWTPTLAELGVGVDLEASLAEAQRLGRDGNATSRLAFLGEILSDDQMVPLRMTIDAAALDAWYDRVDRELGHSPVSAALSYANGTLSITPSIDGLGVDREAATEHLVRALSTLEPVAVALPTRALAPEITTTELEPVRATLAQTVGAPVPVAFDGQSWEIAAGTLAPYLSIETLLQGGKPDARVVVDTARLAPVLRDQFSPLVNRLPADAELGWNNGLVVVTPATIGAVLKADAFAEAVAAYLDGDDGGIGAIDIPVVSTRPKIDGENLGAYGITTLLGQGDSNFEGGVWERDENIRVGAQLLNGTLVPPGGTFSFNGAVGEITYDKGFRESEVIVNEQVGRDVGGGICQVSTTVFRAAILAGMPIVEWHPHSFRLANYERDGWAPGFDASILQMGSDPAGWADFRFQNYTNGWLLVEATITYPHLYISIYGTGDGRTVDLDAWPVGGNAFGFTRVIRDVAGSIVAERSFESHFL
jgi:vancomycin resistance protein YoaR